MPGKKPNYKVFVSREVNGKTFYTEVGAAWNVTGDGISIKLVALPLDGSLVLFPPKEE
jgi:hypothetical protein